MNKILICNFLAILILFIIPNNLNIYSTTNNSDQMSLSKNITAVPKENYVIYCTSNDNEC